MRLFKFRLEFGNIVDFIHNDLGLLRIFGYCDIILEPLEFKKYIYLLLEKNYSVIATSGVTPPISSIATSFNEPFITSS